MNQDLPTFKVAIVGDAKVGKTAVFNRFTRNCFYIDYEPTKKAVIENVVKKVNIPDNTIVSLSMWDLPGREDIDLSDTYFKDLDAAVVVVDVSSDDSIDMAAYYKQLIINNVTKDNDKTTTTAQQTPVLLLGNKYDQVDQTEPVDKSSTETLKDTQDNENNDPDAIVVPKIEENWKPSCYYKLQDIVKSSKFLAGILVSAKDPDGSVHTAMQTLIRHLIEKYFDKRRPAENKRDRKIQRKAAGKDNSSTLMLTGIEAFDIHFEKCKRPMSRVKELKESYEKTLTKFKSLCADAGLISSGNYTRASLEQCITALKQDVGSGEELSADTTDKFVKLTVGGNTEAGVDTSRAIDFFNKGFAKICLAILLECPQIKHALNRLDSNVADNTSAALELLNDESRRDLDVKAIAMIVEQNRVSIAQSTMLCDEVLKHAQSANDKITASLSW